MEQPKVDNRNDHLDAPVVPGGDSIFFDRHDAPFLRWMEGQGLDPQASDRLVMNAMHQYFESHNTYSITDPSNH